MRCLARHLRPQTGKHLLLGRQLGLDHALGRFHVAARHRLHRFDPLIRAGELDPQVAGLALGVRQIVPQRNDLGLEAFNVGGVHIVRRRFHGRPRKGKRPAIEAGAEHAKALGARRAIVLPVSVAAHSPLMAEAADGMRETLATVPFRDPTATLLANADARRITTADGARAELIEHLTAGVDWVGAVESMVAAGVTTFVEIGPGKVLTGLIKRIAPDAEIIPADDPASADRLLELAEPA